MTHLSTIRPESDPAQNDLSFSLIQYAIAQEAAARGLNLRQATAADEDDLVALWHDGWHETHAPLAPPELVERRTMDDFRSRIGCRLPHATVAELNGDIVGFCSIKESQIDQLYLAPSVWGTGIAQALLQDGLARLARRGVTVAWLICAIGNERAAHFYAKMGWVNTGVVPIMTETSSGPIAVNGWRLEKAIEPLEQMRRQDAIAVLIHVAPHAHRLMGAAHRA